MSKPCPFCGCTKPPSFVLCDGGYKWGACACVECEAQSAPVRTGYIIEDVAPWHADALAEWDKRAVHESKLDAENQRIDEANGATHEWSFSIDGNTEIWMCAKCGCAHDGVAATEPCTGEP